MNIGIIHSQHPSYLQESEMTEVTAFDPFNDRKSRDIRNTLSSSLVECLEKNSIAPAAEAAEKFLNPELEDHYRLYIKERLSRFGKAVTTISRGSEDPFWRGLVLWDLELFFEMHEVLEHAWYTAEGDKKMLLQALIRAAGMYIKLEHGFIPQAKKMAGKAVVVLEEQRDFLAEYFQPDLLIDALKVTAPTPPKLLNKQS